MTKPNANSTVPTLAELNQRFENLTSSTKGLGAAIEDYLTDNAGTFFTPSELGQRFDVDKKKMRTVLRSVLALGTGDEGNAVAAATNKKYYLYCLAYSGTEKARNCYGAQLKELDPTTGKPHKI